MHGTISKPDIAFIVNILCHFMNYPINVHWNATKQVLRYLIGIIGYGLLIQNLDY